MSAPSEPDPLRRALAALDLQRPEQAERMLREAIRADPGDPVSHVVLALVLADLEQYQEAEQLARDAIALDPEFSMAHGALARALGGQEHFRAALSATQEAIRLDPEEHLNHELLAACRLAVGDWHGARASAEQALALAPESATAHGLLSRALAMTSDDPAAWRASAAAALAADPGSSAAHALAAHAHLTAGQEGRAITGFEEALRLDPESEYAQAGLAEALKASHPLFRPLYRFFMWQERLSSGARVALIVVPILITRALRLDSGNPVVVALLVVWFGFVALTWVAVPVANLALRLTPRGRAVLPAEQKRSSSSFAALVGGCALALIIAVVVSPVFAGTALALGVTALAVGSGHALAARRQRLFAVVVIVVVIAAFLGATLVSLGVHAGVVLVLAAAFTGLALVWLVRLS